MARTTDPNPDQIQLACLMFQAGWSDIERNYRRGVFGIADATWTVPQFLVHHEESARWCGCKYRKVRVWRCVDGR